MASLPPPPSDSKTAPPLARWFQLLWEAVRPLSASFEWNPGNLAAGAGETSTPVTVAGAELGDFVTASAPYSLQGIACTAYVSAANTVSVRLQNGTGGAIDLAGGTWRVRVLKQQ